MTDSLQQVSTEVLDQRAEWSTPEVSRLTAGNAESPAFNSNDDGSTFVS